MRRVRVVLLQSAIGGAAALRRHTQAGDDNGAHHSPRPLVKTRRYESPVAPARQTPPKVAEVEAPPPAKVQQLEVGERGEGQRLDNFLGRILKDVPRTHIFRVIRKGEVRVNGKRAKPDQRLLASDIVRVPPVRTGAAAPPRRAPPAMVQGLIGAIVYEDPRLLVIDKPAGVAVHGGSGVSFGVIEALRAARPDETLELVHRIDRDTSGLLLVSRKPAALRTLHALMRDGLVEKRYLALVKGKWDLGQKRIDVPLRTDIRVGGERTVKAHESGKEAVSVFKPVQFFGKRASLVEVSLETGRTHQIRVHAAHAGYPLAGDEKYGEEEFNEKMKESGLKRMFLHAHHVSFVWPETGVEFSVSAPLPTDLTSVIDALSAPKDKKSS
jgi:23S rRNA pseudouridine955/2504/2580 synthase